MAGLEQRFEGVFARAEGVARAVGRNKLVHRGLGAADAYLDEVVARGRRVVDALSEQVDEPHADEPAVRDAEVAHAGPGVGQEFTRECDPATVWRVEGVLGEGETLEVAMRNAETGEQALFSGSELASGFHRVMEH